MTSQFPGALDNFTNPTPADNLNTPQVLHSDQHANENDAIEAIEAWVGISGTNEQASHEYRIRQLENTPPGSPAFGVVGWDEGVSLGTGTVLNVVGDDVILTRSGTVLQLTHTNPVIVFPQSQIGVFAQDEGISLGTGTTINFVGQNVDASISGTVIRVFVTGTPQSPVVFPQELIGIMGWDEGQPLGTGTVLNVVGSAGTLSLSGTVLNLDLSLQGGGGGGGIGIVGENQAINIGTGTILNVTETDLTLSRSGTVLELSRTTGTTFYLGVNGSRIFGYRTSGTWLILSNSPDPQEVIGVYGLSNGVPLGSGTWIDFGSNLTAALSGTVLQVNGIAPVYPQEVIGIYGQDEGVGLGTGTTLNAVGNNIALSLSGTTLTLVHTDTPVTFPQEVIGIYGKDEGQNVGTGTILNVVGNNIALSLSGATLTLAHTDTPVTFPQEVIGFYAENRGVPLGTGTILNVNGSRLVATISGTSVELSNSPDPVELIGIFGQDEGVPLGTGTIFNVTGDNISLSLSGTVLNLSHTNPTIAFPQELIGVMGWDDGVPKGTGTIIDFGNNLTATLSGTVLRVDATAGGSTFAGVDQIGMFGQDEGVPVGTGTIFNVTGGRAVLSRSGTVLNFNISPDPQDNIGVALQSEGNFLATGVTIDVMGAVTVSGSIVNLRVPKTVSLVTPAIVGGGLVFTNLAANDTTYVGVVTDLTGYTQCKLGGVFGAASLAVASGTIIHIMWATGSSYANLIELALNKDTEQGRLRWIASTQRATDWFDINPGAAYKDVGLHVRITGGNGTADPNLLGLFAEFR